MGTRPRTPDHFPRMKVRNRGRKLGVTARLNRALEHLTAAFRALGEAFAAFSITFGAHDEEDTHDD